MAWLDFTILLTSLEMRGIKWIKTGGDGRWEESGESGGRGKRGANVPYLLGKVGNKVIRSEGGRRRRGGRGEERRQHGK